METLPRELVWELVGCLSVRDVLLGVALASRDLHKLLCASSPPSWTSNEFWRLYALRWRLVGEGDDALEPPCWRSFCRAELEGWRFSLEESLHVDVPRGRLKVATDESDAAAVRACAKEQGVIKTLLLDKARQRAELLLFKDNWNATLLLVDPSIRFHVTRQTGFWMVGVASPIPQERLPPAGQPSYGQTWDLRLAYNVNGSFHVEVRVEHNVASFFVDNSLRGRPFSLDHLPKPWRFFWGADGADSVVTILPPRHQPTTGP